MRFTHVFIAVSLSVAACGARAQLSLGTGAEFTTGKYGGTTSTEQLYIPFTGKLETGRWTFKATVPYLVVSGPGNVVGGGEDRVPVHSSGSGGGSGSSGSSGGGGSGGSSAAASGAQRLTASGLGDIVTSAFYSLLDEGSSAIGLDIGGRIKFGTADEAERLGTGENDLSLQADLQKALGEATVFGTLGYRWYGDPPGIQLRDVPYWTLGVSYRLSEGAAFGVAYDYRPRIVEGGAAVSEATLFWTKRFSREWKLQLYAVAGFADGSPDAGIGTFVDYRF